jgi:hypothetical protein
MLRIALKGAPKRHLPPERYVQYGLEWFKK